MLQDGQLGYNPKNMVSVSLLVHGGDGFFNAERSFEALPYVDKAGTAWSLPCFGYMPNNPLIDEKSGNVVFPFPATRLFRRDHCLVATYRCWLFVLLIL